MIVAEVCTTCTRRGRYEAKAEETNEAGKDSTCLAYLIPLRQPGESSQRALRYRPGGRSSRQRTDERDETGREFEQRENLRDSHGR